MSEPANHNEVCSGCGKLADQFSEHVLFDIDAAVVGCSRCKLANVAGYHGPWLKKPTFVGIDFYACQDESKAFEDALRERAKQIRSKNENARGERLRCLTVSLDVFVCFLRGREVIQVTRNPLPDDAKLETFELVESRNEIRLWLSSSQFKASDPLDIESPVITLVNPPAGPLIAMPKNPNIVLTEQEAARFKQDVQRLRPGDVRILQESMDFYQRQADGQWAKVGKDEPETEPKIYSGSSIMGASGVAPVVYDCRDYSGGISGQIEFGPCLMAYHDQYGLRNSPEPIVSVRGAGIPSGFDHNGVAYYGLEPLPVPVIDDAIPCQIASNFKSIGVSESAAEHVKAGGSLYTELEPDAKPADEPKPIKFREFF